MTPDYELAVLILDGLGISPSGSKAVGIAAAIRSYGDERAAAMREQCRQVAYRRAQHGSYDASEIAERIAALPLDAEKEPGS